MLLRDVRYQIGRARTLEACSQKGWENRNLQKCYLKDVLVKIQYSKTRLIFGEQGIILTSKVTKCLDEVLRVWSRKTVQEGFRKLRGRDVDSSGRGECPRIFAARAASAGQL